jgi:addiction module HigA family antidote
MSKAVTPGAALAAELDRRGWSQAGLAHRCGITPNAVSRVLANRCGITPRLDGALARILGSAPGHWLALSQSYRQSLRSY